MAVTIPNLKLRNITNALLSFAVTDYTNKLTGGLENECWLYRVFYGVKFGDYDFYQQAINLLTQRGDTDRQLKIRFNYDRAESKPPIIVINTPNRQQSGANAIGTNEGTDSYYENNDGTSTAKYSRSFSGNYELMVISNNVYEAELIYTLLESLFIGAIDTLDQLFDVNGQTGKIEFSGKTLIADPSLVPSNLYIRSFSIMAHDTTTVPRITTEDYASNVIFQNPPTFYDEEGEAYNS